MGGGLWGEGSLQGGGLELADFATSRMFGAQVLEGLIVVLACRIIILTLGSEDVSF